VHEYWEQKSDENSELVDGTISGGSQRNSSDFDLDPIRGAGKPEAECKPRAQGVAKREGNLDEADEGPLCKKEILMEKVMLQKLVMMVPVKEEDVEDIWEQKSEEKCELVEDISMGSQKNSSDKEI